MTKSKNQIEVPPLLARPVPIVITGTLSRDEETLKLVKYLNDLSVSGQIKVFYYPEADLSSAIQTQVKQGEKSKLLNPIRVPEDLVVCEDIYSHSHQDYYRQVKDYLRDNGTQCICVSVPTLSQDVFTHTDFSYRGAWADKDAGFRYGTKADGHVFYENEIAFTDTPTILSLVGAENIGFLHLLSGPKVGEVKVDREKTKKAIIDEIKKLTGDSYKDEYIDAILNHIVKQISGTLTGISGTKCLDDKGVHFLVHSDTKSISGTTIDQLVEIFGKDPEVEKARETAKSIIDEAQLKADSIELDAEGKASEIKDKAQESADDAIEAAIETSALMGELPHILAGPLSLFAAQQKREQDERVLQQQKDSQKIRVDVKEFCDFLNASLLDVKDIELTTWGEIFSTAPYVVGKQQISDVLNKVFNNHHGRVPDAEQISEIVNETNLGITTMRLEHAIAAIGLQSFKENFLLTQAGKRLSDGHDQLLSLRGLQEWTFDQHEIDHALFNAMLAHLDGGTFTPADRLFISTCDHVLGGAITKSLSRSLDERRFNDAMGELGITSADGIERDTDSYLNEVEVIATQSKLSRNGGQLSHTLEQTLAEIEQATSEIPAEQLMMRSDGTVVRGN
ncbi:MAG: hypothetical protein U0R17_03765 [Acidimicrobiia bacterium]